MIQNEPMDVLRIKHGKEGGNEETGDACLSSTEMSNSEAEEPNFFPDCSTFWTRTLRA